MKTYMRYAVAVVMLLVFLGTCFVLVPWLVSMDDTLSLIGGLLLACLVVPMLCIWALNSARIAYESLTTKKEKK